MKNNIRKSIVYTPYKYARFILKPAAVVLAAFCLLAFADHSMAVVVYNVNFSGGVGGSYLPNYSGHGAAPDPAAFTNWNQIQATENGIGSYSAAQTNLVASDGVTTNGINLSIIYSRAYNDSGISGNNLLGSWFQVDGSVNGGGVGLVTISGLPAGSTYDLYVYGVNGGFTGRGTRFIINKSNWVGGTDDNNPQFNWLQTTGADGSSPQAGVNYVRFSGVQPSNGNIEFYIGANPAGGNDQGPINGLQLVVNNSYSPLTNVVYNLNLDGGIGGSYVPSYSGLGAALDSTDNTNWNQIQATENGIGSYTAAVTNLVASDGVTTNGIDLSITYNRAYNDTGISGNNLLGSWFQSDQGGANLVRITGLAAGSYDLYLYGINGGFTGRGTIFSFNINYWTAGPVDPGNSSFHYLATSGSSASSLQEGVNYVHVAGVESFNNEIQFYYKGNPDSTFAGNDQGPINGLQLVTYVPKPEVMKLSGVLVNGMMNLSSVGIPGQNYSLDRSFSLSPPDWVPQVTNMANALGTLIYTNAPNPATNNFWRLRSVQ